jgi:DNA-binding NtrC family response regulator
MWSRKHERCIGCGTTEIKHIALGFCLNCYRKLLNERHTGYRGQAEKIKNTKLKGKKPSHLLTKEYLNAEYNLKKRSLGEIAKECGSTRTFVYRRLRSLGIKPRDKTTART